MPPSDFSSPRRIVFFDFDGTLSKGDSGWRFFLFCMRLKDLPRLMFHSIFLAKDFLCGKLDRSLLKERCFGALVKGRTKAEIHHLAAVFSESYLNGKNLYQNAMARLKWHKKQGDRCILVSASLGEYLKIWAKKHGFEAVLATRLAAGKDGVATGYFMGKNCYGPQKLKRILRYLKVSQIPFRSVAYGNSAGDFEMLEAVLRSQGGESWFVLPNGEILPFRGRNAKMTKAGE